MTIRATNTLESINPATGEVVGSVNVTPATEIADVVVQARAAQPAWNALCLEGRLALKMKCHAAAVRGLAIAMGLENKMYVEAHIIKFISDQLSYDVEESENTIRITMCISESEVQRIKTFGNIISNTPK